MRRRKQNLDMIDITVVDGFNRFIEEKKAINLSDSTLETYKLHINSFIDLLDLRSNNITCSFLTSDLYIMWLEILKEDENKKDVTVTSYSRSVRAWLYWLMDNDYMESENLKLPKYQKITKKTYTDEELKILLDTPSKDCSEVEYLSWIFINLCLSTGLRLSSLLNIKVCDYDKKEKFINITHTKNKESKTVYLNNEMASILNKYITLFDLNKNDFLFCTAEKTKLAKRSIQDYISKYNRKRGVEKTSIHLFRHTFAKNYYLKTKDIYSLCNLLGHSSVSTTQEYLKDLDVKDFDFNSYNPQIEYSSKINKKKRRGKISS